jgi:3-deoxy-D-manno-octulosonic-acid transferase
MIVLYNAALFFLRLGFRFASLFHAKAKAFVEGRKNILATVKETLKENRSPMIWVHCASLGEFEQGRPIIESLKKEFPTLRVLLTFFSPSGYEVRKNYNQADYVFYLPWDTASNAKEFVDAVNPTVAIFVKYEFWYHYTRVLKSKNIPLISVSAIFRPSQLFFKSYGGFYRGILANFSYFFVQNDTSKTLLKEIGFNNVTVAGDTRFDRVHAIVKEAGEVPVAKKFKADQRIMVAGSCWAEDMAVLMPFINEGSQKFIIAPHEITETFLSAIEQSLQVKSIRFSKSMDVSVEDYQVLLIDNIGMLSKLYRYGEFAFVGGAFGKGLHNVLEAACYGVPIFFGNKNFQKFQEAVDLINRGGAFEVADYMDLKEKYEMINAPESFLLACEVTRSYVTENLGATEKIMAYCRKLIR